MNMHDRIKAIPLLDAALTGIALGGWHAPAAYKLGHDVATDAAPERRRMPGPSRWSDFE